MNVTHRWVPAAMLLSSVAMAQPRKLVETRIGMLVRVAIARAQVADTVALSGCFRFDKPYFYWNVRTNNERGVATVRTAVVELGLRSLYPWDSLTKVLKVRPIPFAVDSMAIRRYVMPSHWAIRDARTIEVKWWNGLDGVRFTLTVDGDTLRGTVNYLSDVVYEKLPPHRQSVPPPAWAVRIRCEKE